mmetsp:Transcript_63500/g.175012  ORF Transcript_63500/g.175012 Transcript_63500/m.175012 type:complete len:267 (+) Transcript_63500:2175-2975(+)
MDALTPVGVSVMIISDVRSNAVGSFGWMSADRKSRNCGCAVRPWMRFSSVLSQSGQRWMLRSSTHPPDFALVEIMESARSYPSELPMATDATFRFTTAARASTWPLASWPGAEQSSNGTAASLSSSTTALSSCWPRHGNWGPSTVVTYASIAATRRSGRSAFTTRRPRKAARTPPGPPSAVPIQYNGTSFSADGEARKDAHAAAASPSAALWARPVQDGINATVAIARSCGSVRATPHASRGEFTIVCAGLASLAAVEFESSASNS